MDTKKKTSTEKQITVEEVNRVLEVGRLLFSVLTPEEIEELQKLVSPKKARGMDAKMRAGCWPAKAPEGYLNKERQISSNKYDRWVEADPDQIKALKDAWEMLLTGRYTIIDICEELTRRGHVRSRGRPRAWEDPKSGRRKTGERSLTRPAPKKTPDIESREDQVRESLHHWQD